MKQPDNQKHEEKEEGEGCRRLLEVGRLSWIGKKVARATRKCAPQNKYIVRHSVLDRWLLVDGRTEESKGGRRDVLLLPLRGGRGCLAMGGSTMVVC